jgi:hypothetical protein
MPSQSKIKQTNKQKRNTRQPARHITKLAVLMKWISSWQFEGVHAQTTIRSHWGLQTSIRSIMSLSAELLEEGFEFVCTSRFNQDCLDNFFAVVRSKNGWHENPNVVQFMSAFRDAIVLSSIDAQSGGKNCIDDEDFVLISHSDILLDVVDVSTFDSCSTDFVSSSCHVTGADAECRSLLNASVSCSYSVAS